MIDVKYFAGFVDSDGSILIHVQKRDNGRYGLYPKVNIGQLAFRAQNLHELAKHYDVNLNERKAAEMLLIDLVGNKARNFIELIKNHLVIKKDLADYILQIPSEVSKEELDSIKKVVKSLRKKDIPDKNHPSRKWMAGYIDGDGCFTAQVKQNGTLNARLVIASAVDALAGLHLIQKAFGGSIRTKGNSAHYELHLSLSKTKELLDYCGEHLRIKKTQSVLVRNRIGENKHSKSHGATYETNKAFCEALATTKYIGRY
jgi:hypothetical protein